MIVVTVGALMVALVAGLDQVFAALVPTAPSAIGAVFTVVGALVTTGATLRLPPPSGVGALFGGAADRITGTNTSLQRRRVVPVVVGVVTMVAGVLL